MDKRKKFFKTAAYWILLNIGTLLLAAGVYFFKAPNNFATGGVSGIAIILQKYIPLNQSVIMLIINSVLLIIGFIILGKGCTLKTLYCSLVYSGENLLFSYICPLDKPLTNQPLMELVYAILMTGIGSAIIFNCQASSGGTDIVALILKKYTKLNVGRALLLTDFLIASSTFFIFGIEAGLYSMLGLFAKAFLVDGVIESIGKSKYLQIITKKPQEIGKYIIENVKRDYTSYVGEGGYTGQQKTILVTVCKSGEALKIKAKVKEIDPDAFVIISDATEILGKGFRETT
jgi:uncharacterized membrane-anchored protein YitT (DUF2179 family)